MRRRNIGGIYSSITEDDYLINANEGSINFQAEKNIAEIGINEGVSYSNYKQPPPAAKVTQIEGPFDENWNHVDFLARDEYYYYRATIDKQLKKEEITKLKWTIKYNDKKALNVVYNGGTLLEDGKIGMRLSINLSKTSESFNFYAHFNERNESVKLNVEIEKGEVLLVVGTEQHSATIGNKLMFPAQAVREIKENFSTHNYTNVIIFKDGYTPMQLSIIKRDAKRWNSNVYFKEINSNNELISYINNGDATINRSTSKIGIIKIFAHGLPSILDFGLDGQNEASQRFLVSDIKRLNKNSFARFPIITSFACRTGNIDSRVTASVNGFSYGTDWESFVRPQESFAQKISDHLDGKTYSYLKRSNYSPTWNDGGNQNYIKDYVHIKDEGISNFYNPKDWLRNWNRWDEALWNINGAYSPPKAGNTPGGLPSDIYQFQKDKTPTKKE